MRVVGSYPAAEPAARVLVLCKVRRADIRVRPAGTSEDGTMRTFLLATSAAMLLVVFGDAGVMAQASAEAKTSASSTAATKSSSATGKIVGFDDTSKTLTLSTAKGEEKFVLGSSARLQE